MNVTKKFQIVSGAKTDFELHADDCDHGKRNMLQRLKGLTASHEQGRVFKDIDKALAWIVGNGWMDADMMEQGYSMDDVRLMDCARTELKR